MDMQPKSGFKSSEFYLTVANSIVGILMTLGYVTPAQADDLIQAVAAVMGGLVVIVSTGLYIYSRVKLKQAATPSITTRSTVPNQPMTKMLENLAEGATPGVYPV